MITHDDLRVNRIFYKLVEKEFSKLSALIRVEDLYPYKQEIEHLFAQYVGVPYAFLLDSGTTALYVAFALVGIRQGDEVILPVLSWPSAITAILARGGVPRFVDIKEDCTLDEQQVTVTKKTKCLLPVHMYGHAAALQLLLNLGIPIVEDCCQAHGTRINKKMVGSFGVYGTFSFDPYKTISSLGTGGGITFHAKEDKENIRSLLSIEKADKHLLALHRTPGKMSYTDMACIKAKLRLATVIEKRKRQCAMRYEERLAGSPVQVIPDREGVSSVRQSYLVYVPQRDNLFQWLTHQGIICKEPYLPAHHLPLFQPYAYGGYPVADRYVQHALILPLFPLMETGEVDRVCDTILAFYNSNS